MWVPNKTSIMTLPIVVSGLSINPDHPSTTYVRRHTTRIYQTKCEQSTTALEKLKLLFLRFSKSTLLWTIPYHASLIRTRIPIFNPEFTMTSSLLWRKSVRNWTPCLHRLPTLSVYALSILLTRTMIYQLRISPMMKRGLVVPQPPKPRRIRGKRGSPSLLLVRIIPRTLAP